MKLPSEHLDVKLIAFDLDDTLLNHDLKITPKTVDAIRRAASKGIQIVLCSGRAENAMLPYVRALDIAGTKEGRYLIGINGARILDLHTRLPVYTKNLDAEILSFVYHEAQKRNMPAQVYDSSTIYSSADTKWARLDSQLCGLGFEVVDDFESFLKKGFPKILISAPVDEVNSFMPELKEMLDEKAEVFTSKPFFLEVMPYGCGKGQSVLHLADILGIPRNQTMAFGDSLNDESMIRLTEYGVAMLNGIDYIKDAARFVTRRTNEEDGIADFLEEYVL